MSLVIDHLLGSYWNYHCIRYPKVFPNCTRHESDFILINTIYIVLVSKNHLYDTL